MHRRPTDLQIDTTSDRDSGLKRARKREKVIIIMFKNSKKTSRAPPRNTNPEKPHMNERQALQQQKADNCELIKSLRVKIKELEKVNFLLDLKLKR